MLLVFAVFVGWRLDLRGLFSLPAATHTLRRVFAEGYGQLFVYHAISAIFANVNILLLRHLVDDHDLAAFGSAYRYYLLLFLASAALKSVFPPQVQNASTAAALAGIFQRHRLMVAAYVPVVAVAAILAQWAIPLVDQGRYPEAVTVFRILCVSTVLSFAFSAYMTLLMKYRRFLLLICLITAGVAFNLVVSYTLIVSQGIVGAAIATVLAYGAVNFAVFFSARSTLRDASELERGDPAPGSPGGAGVDNRGGPS
jgi:O-antigen/teichoic acid export membrane protein